jgi:NADH-quinone oxidoreductase subunit I
VTQQYPENRKTLKFPERYRSFLRLVYEDSGFHRCNGCRLCERACPNASIKVVTRRGATGKLEIDQYIWRMDSCTFCNACVQACPSDSLEMTHEFENAVYDRRLLVFGLNRYAGPSADIMEKEPDPEKRKAMMEPRGPYGGPVPMAGHPLPNIRPLGKPPQDEAGTPPPAGEGQTQG